MRRRAWLALGVVAIAGLGACDGDDDAAVPTSTTETVTTETVTATSVSAGPSTSSPGSVPITVPPATSQAPAVTVASTVPEATPVPGTTGDIDRPPVPAESEGQELGPLGSTELDVDTGAGTVQLGDADIPDLAAELPVPVGLDVQLASETETDAGFTGVAPGSVNELGTFYRDALPERGFTITSETGDGDGDDAALVVLSFESNTKLGSVVITRSPGEAGTSVLVTIQQR